MEDNQYLVDGIRLNPDAGVRGRDNLDIGLGDKVRDNLLDRVRLGQSGRVDREAGGGEGDSQSFSVGDVESVGHDIGLGHRVVDRGWNGLKLPKVKTTGILIREVETYLCVSDGVDHGFDRLVGNRHSRWGRTILATAQGQTSAN